MEEWAKMWTWGEVIGRHGEETQNDNGRRLLGSCATNGLTIINGCFEHKDIHKYTWESRGQGLRTIIDYFAVRKTLRQSVADLKVIRGAEAGSDHYLVLMTVTLRWTRGKKEVRNEGNRLRLRKLRNWEARMRFQTELKKPSEEASNRLIDDAEEVWKGFKEAFLAVTERVVGRQKAGRQRKQQADGAMM